MLNELDLQLLWKDLDAFDKQLVSEATELKSVHDDIVELKKNLEHELKETTSVPEFTFLPRETNIQLKVGGQEFSVPVEVLTRDPASLLAMCCRVDVNDDSYPNVITIDRDVTIIKDAREVFFFDRDWWLFRLILSFLRSNILPNDSEVLKQLYAEACFYSILSLKTAIEAIPLHHFINSSS